MRFFVLVDASALVCVCSRAWSASKCVHDGSVSSNSNGPVVQRSGPRPLKPATPDQHWSGPFLFSFAHVRQWQTVRPPSERPRFDSEHAQFPFCTFFFFIATDLQQSFAAGTRTKWFDEIETVLSAVLSRARWQSFSQTAAVHTERSASVCTAAPERERE